MPRVHTKTRGATRKHTYTCNRCGEEIVKGDEFYEWSFRYGGTSRRHTRCGYPRPSELTQSIMSEVYAAQESAHDAIDALDEKTPQATAEALEDVVRSVGDSVQSVVDQYREADESFGGQGATQSGERAEELEAWQYDLEAYQADWDDDVDENDLDEAINNLKDEARELIDGCPL